MKVLLVLCSLVFLLEVLVLTHKTSDLFNLKLPSINLFYYGWYLIIFLSSIAIFFESDTSYDVSYFLMMAFGACGFPIGIICANILCKYSGKENRRYSLQSIDFSSLDKKMKDIYPWIFAVSIGLIFLYMYEVKEIPIIYMLKGGKNAQEFALMRENSFKLLNSRFIYLYAWNRTVILPYLSMYSFAAMLIKEELRWRIWFFITLPVALFNASFSGAEAPIAEIFLLLFFILYIKKKGRLNILYYVFGVAIVLSYSIILPMTIGGEMNILSTVSSVYAKVLKRFSIDTAERLFNYVKIFSIEGFLYGRGNRLTALLTGQDFFNIPNHVFVTLYPKLLASGHANAPFVGYMYADFGLLGSLIGAIFMGITSQLFQIYFTRREKNIMNIVSYTFCINAFRKMLSTSLTTVLITHGPFILILLPSIIKVFHEFLKTSTSRRPKGDLEKIEE